MLNTAATRTQERIALRTVAVEFTSHGRFRHLLMSSVLALADLCTLTASITFGFLLWLAVNPAIPRLNAIMLLVPGACVFEFIFSGHYPGIGLTATQHLRRIWRGITLVYLLVTAVMFLTKVSLEESRGALLLGWSLSLLLVPVGRWIVSHAFGSRSWWGAEAVLIGAGETGRAVVSTLKAHKILGYRIVVCIDDNLPGDGTCAGVPVVGTLIDAAVIAARYGTRCAIIALPDIRRENLSAEFQRWSHIFPKIVVISELPGMGTLWAEARDMGGLLGLELQHNLLNRWNQRLKRTFDVVASAAGLLVAAPLLAICAVWIKRVSPGRAFYSQLREGKDGQIIGVLKLRTMYPDAERMLEKHLAGNEAARQQWDRYCKLKRDPRILPGIGHFLRKTSLDELPQLWNVLKGDMSLVGPRPFPDYHNARFHPDFREIRTQVAPGLTGLWQVSARSDGDLDVQKGLDSYYIRNWSLWLDLYILFRTVRVIFTQEGSY